MVQGPAGGCEDQARTPAAAGGAMVGSSTWRGFGIEAAGRREAKGVCLPAFRPRCRERETRCWFSFVFHFLICSGVYSENMSALF